MKCNKPLQKKLPDIENGFASTSPLELRVSCASLGRMFGVSRTTIKRYVDAGKIELDANKLACPKQAAQSMLESPTRIKSKFFKSQIDSTTALQNEVARLNARVIELEGALSDKTNDLDEWQRDYWHCNSAAAEFIRLLTMDKDFKKAVAEGDSDFLESKLDDLIFI